MQPSRSPQFSLKIDSRGCMEILVWDGNSSVGGGNSRKPWKF